MNICISYYLDRILCWYMNYMRNHFLLSTRIWFWVKDPTSDSASHFNWDRDSIYGATILLGAGGATVLVISMAKIAYLVGEYTVSMEAAYLY